MKRLPIKRCHQCVHYSGDNTLLPPKCLACQGWKPGVKVKQMDGSWYAGEGYKAKETA